MIDQPPQYYFVFNGLNSTNKNASKSTQKSALSQLPPIDIAQGNMYTKNFEGFNYQAFPVGKGKILVRLENILDKFDNKASTRYFDLVTFSKALWTEANDGKASPTPKIEEMTISGVQTLLELKKEDAAWKVIEAHPVGVITNTSATTPVPSVNSTQNAKAQITPEETTPHWSAEVHPEKESLEQTASEAGDEVKTEFVEITEGDLSAPSHLGQAKYKSSMDKNGLWGVALDPMAIRTFQVDFSAADTTIAPTTKKSLASVRKLNKVSVNLVHKK